LRIFRIADEELVNYINVQDYITALCIFPNDDQIIIGTHTGKCQIYDLKSDEGMRNENIQFNINKKYTLQTNYSFEIEDNTSKAKITSIRFINKDQILVTVNDNITRILKVSNGQVIKVFLGNKNSDTLLKSSYDEIFNKILCSGDDGKVYVWSNNNKEKAISILKSKVIICEQSEIINPFVLHNEPSIRNRKSLGHRKFSEDK